MADEVDRLKEITDDLQKQVARLETLADTEADRCPFREEVAQISLNVVALEKLNGKVTDNTEEIHAIRRANARWAGLAAGAGAVLGSMGGELAKAIAELFS